AMHVDNGDLHLNSPVTGDMVFHIEKGKTTTTVNGQPQESNPQLEAMLPNLQSRVLRVLPTGKLLRDANAAPADSAEMRMSAAGATEDQVAGGYGMLLLPKKLVKVGESWTETEVNTVPLPGGKSVKTTSKIRFTLKQLVQRNGHQVAVIDSVATTTAPRMST